MKRLLRVSFDIFITSLTPIISWFLIGIILDKSLSNVFSLTYPMQCVMGIIISIFGIGANVSRYKDKINNEADNGIFYGSIVSIMIYGFIAINCDKYIEFMNMDKEIYMTFCKYSVIQILLQTILQLNLSKLYYIEENKKANKISLLFNLINFILLIGTAIITKNQMLTSTITLIVLSIFDIILLLKNIDKIDFKFKLINCFRYDSVSCCVHIMFFIIYLVGLSNSFAFGEKYIIAITFATLVTDIQWDITSAIQTVAKIDITKGKFNYQYHFRNALKLNLMLISSVLLMSFIMYPFYKPDIRIVSIFLILHIYDFMINAFKNIKISYLEIEDSAVKMATNTVIAYIIRMFISFMPTPFCTIIGQTCSTTYELICSKINYRKYEKLN